MRSSIARTTYSDELQATFTGHLKIRLKHRAVVAEPWGLCAVAKTLSGVFSNSRSDWVCVRIS